MAQLNNLDAKVVWITGASSGLGEALAKECALQGAEVVLTARRFDELEKVRVGLLNPDQHISICADITDEAQVRHAYEQVLQKKGRIDWLINNAGLSQRAEVANEGVDVSVIFPGFVKTNVSFNALNGEGKPQGHQDEAIENGLEPDIFAQTVVSALLKGEEYIVVGGRKEKMGVLVSRLSPTTLYKMIRKMKVK